MYSATQTGSTKMEVLVGSPNFLDGKAKYHMKGVSGSEKLFTCPYIPFSDPLYAELASLEFADALNATGVKHTLETEVEKLVVGLQLRLRIKVFRPSDLEEIYAALIVRKFDGEPVKI